MDYSNEICIVCEKPLTEEFESNVPLTYLVTAEDELRDLRVFMCKIFCIPSSYFEYSGFPVCKVCTNTKIKNLLRMHNDLLALQISYKTLKENVLRDIISVYLNRNGGQLNSNQTRLREAIIKKWQDYTSDFSILTMNDKEMLPADDIYCNPLDEVKKEVDSRENSPEDEDRIKDDVPEEEEQFSPLMSPRSISEDEYLPNDPLEDNSKKRVLRRSTRKRKLRSKKSKYSEVSNTSLKLGRRVDEDNTNEGANEATDFPDESLTFKIVGRRSAIRNTKKGKIIRVFKYYQCPHCPTTANGMHGIKTHLRVHTGERPYNCSDCNQAFRQYTHLLTHRKLKHGYAGKEKTAEGLNEIASKNRFYNCSLCFSATRSKGHYLRHLKEKHIGKEIQEGESIWFYYCDAKDCLVSCTDQDSLKKHFTKSHKLNSEVSSFPQCKTCDRIFAVQENLDNHQRCHSLGNNEQSFFGCQYCHQIFQSENELKVHLPRHKVTCDISQIFCFVCDICGKNYKDLSTLLLHKRKAHKNNSNKPPKVQLNASKTTKNKDNSRNYECWLCFHWFKCRGFFIRHLKSYHLAKEVKDGDSFWFYNCDVKDCLASCGNEEQLHKHFQSSHDNLAEGGKFPQCNNCQRVFALQENLERHQNCHSNDLGDQSKFSCDFCPNLFLTDTERNEHMLQHKVLFDLSDFSHLCDLCGESYRYIGALYQHKRVVHQIKGKVQGVRARNEAASSMGFNNLHCGSCPFKASTPTNLQLHIEKIHPEVETPYKLLRNCCQYCEKKFYMTTELHQHSIRYHASEYLLGRSFCISCYNTFETEEEMEAHFKEQHSDLFCPVETCRRKFPTKVNLSRHMNTHNKEKPFFCEYCPEGFAQEAALQYHINRKHTFHRSFFCKLCPDNPGYYERIAFKKHAEMEHLACAVKDILITKYPKRKYFF